MTCLRWEYRVTFVGAIPLLFFFFDTKTKNLRTPWFWLLSFGCKVLSLWMLVEFSFFIQMFLPCCESMLFSLTYWVVGSMNPGHFSTCFFVVFVNIYHLFHHNVHQFVFIFLNSIGVLSFSSISLLYFPSDQFCMTLRNKNFNLTTLHLGYLISPDSFNLIMSLCRYCFLTYFMNMSSLNLIQDKCFFSPKFL